MPWQSLGSIQVSEDWQSFPDEALNVETLRLLHTTVVDSLNSCYLSRFFPLPVPGGRLAPWLRIYPSAEPVILNLPIPADYRAQNILVYAVQVRRKLPYYPVPWTIELQALY